MGGHPERRSGRALPRARAGRFGRGLPLLALASAVLLVGAQGPGQNPDKSPGPNPDKTRTVARCELTGTVDAGSAAYVADCIQRAQARGDEALLLRLDTPGGSLEATRQLVGAILNAPVPVLVWVGPAGARAGSAGVFVTLAGHVAAMAPGTNIGAAHPVEGPAGADPERAGGAHLAQKVENDAVAFAQAIARQRGRNEAWAAAAVRESESVLAERAVELNVVDLLAASEQELLAKADGRTVRLPSGERQLRLAGAALESLSPTLGQQLVHGLSNPSVAFLLFLSGALLIIVELSHPGGFAAGLIGAACLVLALVAFSALPIRAGAVVLMLLGVGFIIAELFASHGLLALAGTGLLALGGVLLVDRARPGWMVDRTFGLPPELVLPTVAVLGGAAFYVVLKAGQTRRLPQRGGDAGLVGERGRALSPLGARGGEVFVHGERWRAVAERDIPEGAPVVVRRVDGLTLYVEEAAHGQPVGSPDPVGVRVRRLHLWRPRHQRV